MARQLEKLKINPEYESLVVPLSEAELTTLEESIKKDGVWVPIIINEKNEILDGHHRYKICQKLGLDLNVVYGPKHEHPLYEKLFVIDANIKRRNLNKWKRGRLQLRKKPIFKELAKLHMSLGGKGLSIDRPLGEVLEALAKEIGIGQKTLVKIENIEKHATPEQKAQLDSEEISIDYLDKMLRRSDDHKKPNIPKIPHGEYDIILADPPWSYDINTRGSPDEHYAVMTNQAIEDLQIPAAENAILFLWATGPKIREALRVINEWGFTYKTSAVWVKDKIGTGYYFRGQHELLLVAEKGDMPIPEEKNRPSSVIVAPRLEHSQKPDVVYDMIEKMYPNRSYIELFARQKRKGWKSWGNEIKP